MKENIKPLITEKAIEKRISELAAQISADYAGKTVCLVCVLKGAIMFMTDLARKLTIDVEYSFMAVSSYGDGTKSSGTVKIDYDLDRPITGRDVLLIEDIIDSGRTLSSIHNHLISQKPKSLKLCTLLDKPDQRVINDVTPEYIGFEIPDLFVVGYGLDFAQKYRNLPYIGVMTFQDEN